MPFSNVVEPSRIETGILQRNTESEARQTLFQLSGPGQAWCPAENTQNLSAITALEWRVIVWTVQSQENVFYVANTSIFLVEGPRPQSQKFVLANEITDGLPSSHRGGDPTSHRGGDPTSHRGGDPTSHRGGDPTSHRGGDPIAAVSPLLRSKKNQYFNEGGNRITIVGLWEKKL